MDLMLEYFGPEIISCHGLHKAQQARKALILQFAKSQTEYHEQFSTPLIEWSLIFSILIVNCPCNVTNTKCKLNIVDFGHYKFTMLQLLSLTKYFNPNFIHDNISSHKCQDAKYAKLCYNS